jgi:hypothetical protein
MTGRLGVFDHDGEHAETKRSVQDCSTLLREST